MELTQDLTYSPLSNELASILRCTSCRAPLTQGPNGLVCERCSRSFPYLRGTWRFVEANNYADSFGFQWHRYSRTQLDDDSCRNSESHFGMKTGFKPEDLKGKLVLDVGCGMGRFAEVATRWGARVVGVDLSTGVEVAARNLKDRDFV